MLLLLFGPGHLFVICHRFLVEAWLGATLTFGCSRDERETKKTLYTQVVWKCLGHSLHVPAKRQLYECALANSL
jgi:hypothetical protein